MLDVECGINAGSQYYRLVVMKTLVFLGWGYDYYIDVIDSDFMSSVTARCGPDSSNTNADRGGAVPRATPNCCAILRPALSVKHFPWTSENCGRRSAVNIIYLFFIPVGS